MLNINLPLFSCTNLPVVYNTFSFGGDDYIGKLEQQLDKDDPILNIVHDIDTCYRDIVKQYFKGDIDEETYIKNIELIKFTYVNYKKTLEQLESSKNFNNDLTYCCEEILHNEEARIKIVEALGGEELCKTIPVIYPKTLSDYHYFTLKDTPEGSLMAQYEDAAGRKGVLIKVIKKDNDQLCVIWLCQRYRETCCFRAGGRLWMILGIYGTCHGVDECIKFLNQLNNCTHPVYKLA